MPNTGDLKTLALTALDNTTPVTDAVVQAAYDDAVSIAGSKSISDASFLDIAFYRLCFRLKAEISEDLAFLYKQATEELAKTNLGSVSGSGILPRVKSRANSWA